jgi:hypothetical protein
MYEEQAKPEEALKLYEDILQANNPQFSSVGAQAAMRREVLVKAHPELVKTNPPPILNESVYTTNLVTRTNLPASVSTNRVVLPPSTNLVKGTNALAPPVLATNLAATNLPVAVPLTNLLKTTNVAVPLLAATNGVGTNRSLQVPLLLTTNQPGPAGQ